MTEETTHFGFKKVATEEKEALVGEVFTAVAAKYDLMNDMMSGGVHRLWKRHFVATSGIHQGDLVLDLAGGTGDIAKLLMPQIGKQGKVIIGDINQAMLDVGNDRMIDAGFMGRFECIQMNAEKLPFEDNSIDAITMAFGLRNVTNKQQALNEMYRVLKPSGKAMVLEFSKVNSSVLKKLYHFYSFKILPEIGHFVANDRDSYQYLVESIEQHPDQETLKSMFERAGLEMCGYENLSGGIVAIHQGYKL
ncbi:bifunctional demethylmenaquinone methyltransferase/2-methoxy-6-polyprenyl-1,4-benzoquinol methylase UbiE [Marinicella litoralis]|uniref:Ubiquinone/menaquinone biosynthesis C-methyltransferase UbiE n=1 Tax=Marinicella litoralis TaxID=644220 RepID=A0A4R6XVR5_9GAMM|nr:bifunctional demethylmenaquinone methyltransferase/2-methoxy-6-polyprenyl-1,4-benzoquinol methylase UbiE [Marinicella litoralis]TDR22510.1 2-octaprenyl-6-methoxy-1,4-benzoquinone methylase /demethylmenaquinone methyltransferase [Marinicella litoralis]